MEIRLFKKGDIEQISQLFSDAVKIIDAKNHTESQIRSWAPDNIHFRDWEEYCLREFSIVAEVNWDIVGFAQLEYSGHINALYCHPEFRGQGIGGQLFATLEEYACSKRIPTLFTETNPSAYPFFTKLGFREVQKQKVIVGGKVLQNYVIQKKLTD